MIFYLLHLDAVHEHDPARPDDVLHPVRRLVEVVGQGEALEVDGLD